MLKQEEFVKKLNAEGEGTPRDIQPATDDTTFERQSRDAVKLYRYVGCKIKTVNRSIISTCAGLVMPVENWKYRRWGSILLKLRCWIQRCMLLN